MKNTKSILFLLLYTIFFKGNFLIDVIVIVISISTFSFPFKWKTKCYVHKLNDLK